MIYRGPERDLSIPDSSLAAFVMRDFASFGDRPAVVDASSGRSLSYAQLVDGVRRMAVGLAKRGIERGQAFAILLPNVPEYAVAFLGVAAAGGVATTLNPLMTPDEIRHQLKDTGARWLLTLGPLVERAREGAEGTRVEEIFCLGDGSDATPFSALLADDGPMPQVQIDPANDLVALPYSSGTSGLPKGVMLTHRNIVAQLCQANQVFTGDSEGRVIAVAPFFHILGMVLILLLWLQRGGTIVAMPRFELEGFLEAVQKYRVKYASLVPPIMLALAKHPLVDKYDLSSLEWVSSGAAPLGGEIEKACSDRLGCPVGQGWGMTELAGAGTSARLAEVPVLRHGSNGLLWPGLEARIVDLSTEADQGPGKTGELWVRGPQVMKGYLNRPDATASTLTPDGWMRTGDIAYFDDDGFLYIVDRAKELIKYNGYQVAPAELEAVMVSHPAVAEAAVVPSPDPEHGEVPKAFVVLKSPATADELMDFVAERVSAYKKVRRLEIVDSIPKSASGKLLRRMLVEREREAARS